MRLNQTDNPDYRYPNQVMLIAGEESGDRLGAELIQAWKEKEKESARRTLTGTTNFFGAGGPLMRHAGMEVAEELTQHAVVGLFEVLKHYGTFRAIFHWLLELSLSRKPEAIILIDYPGFNLRFAKALRQRIRIAQERDPSFTWNPKIVFYVSPQLWAWKASRAKQMERDLDLVLSIFPFEKDWYANRAPNLPVTFVGHPIVDRFADTPICEPVGVDQSNSDKKDGKGNQNTPKPHLLLLPGSRKREITLHTEPVAQAVEEIKKLYPEARFKWIFPNQARKEQALGILDKINLPPNANDTKVVYQIGDLYSALRTADLAIASSGTVTLECAYFRVPTVVIYRTHPWTFWIGKRIVKTPYLAMPNILCGKEVFPEYLQDDLTSEALSGAVNDWLSHPGKVLAIREELNQMAINLGQTGAKNRVVEAILQLFQRKSST